MNSNRNPFTTKDLDQYEDCRVEVMKAMSKSMPHSDSASIIAALAYTLGVTIGRLAPDVILAMGAANDIAPVVAASVLLGADEKSRHSAKG